MCFTEIDIKCTFAYHHFNDIEQQTKVLAHFLAPGGMLLIVDFLAEKDALKYEDRERIVAQQHGFSKEVVKAAFEGAGLGRFKKKDLEKVMM